MARNPTMKPLTRNTIAAARPRKAEYTLWDGALAHFGVRVHPSGARSFIIQTRVNGRMRKLTLGRFSETSLADARKEAVTVLARVWTGQAVASSKTKPPLFRDFAATYRERRRSRWMLRSPRVLRGIRDQQCGGRGRPVHQDAGKLRARAGALLPVRGCAAT